jgi:hypothetical protein
VSGVIEHVLDQIFWIMKWDVGEINGKWTNLRLYPEMYLDGLRKTMIISVVIGVFCKDSKKFWKCQSFLNSCYYFRLSGMFLTFGAGEKLRNTISS